MQQHFAAPISAQIWDEKYRHKAHDGEVFDQTVEDTWRRIARALAAVETRPSDWEEVFYEALSDFKFLPAGRITAGAGTARYLTTLSFGRVAARCVCGLVGGCGLGGGCGGSGGSG